MSGIAHDASRTSDIGQNTAFVGVLPSEVLHTTECIEGKRQLCCREQKRDHRPPSLARQLRCGTLLMMSARTNAFHGA